LEGYPCILKTVLYTILHLLHCCSLMSINACILETILMDVTCTK
jgi:hypothetical protein